MTKSVLVTLSIISVIALLVAIPVWFFSIIPLDTLFFILAALLLFLFGWWLARHGHWRTGSIIPPLLLLASAFYGNIIGGIDAPAMIIYVFAILLVTILRGASELFWVLPLSVCAYLGAGLLHYYGFMYQQRSADTAFINRILITITVMVGISFLVRFLIIQFRQALQRAHDEIAERKMIEAALRESERKYRELVESANSIILRMNMRGEVTFWNKFAETFFGYTSEEILGRHVNGTIVPHTDSSGEDLHKMIADILDNPGQYELQENENITRAGKRVWVAWANRPIYDAQGRVTEILCIGIDVTARKQAQAENEIIQKQLIQAQKMEAIGTLTSGLAHDFNNILAGIMGSLSLLKMHLAESTHDEKSDEYIGIAVSASQRASDMIKQMLLLSRRHDIQLTTVDLNGSLRHVVTICRSSFSKSISIVDTLLDTPAVVQTDPILIEQIFLNLCVNASHAMTIMRGEARHFGGTLSVAVHRVMIDTENIPAEHRQCQPGSYVNVVIRDTGVGMDDSTRKRIFEPFFTTKKNDGTGLGLSIAYGFINQCGGFITVASEVGQGTAFNIYLPECVDSCTIENPAEEKSLVSGQGTVLVIDDEQAVLNIAREILVLCGYRVLVAGNGPDGIELYHQHAAVIDAVLLDLSMPGLSGVEVLDVILDLNSGAKVLFSSGYADDPGVSRAMDRGAAGFIQKPYTAETLSRKMAEIIGL